MKTIKNKCFGAKVIVTLNNRRKISEQLERADAHPYGARPFKRKNYIKKFKTLTDKLLSKKESERYLKTVILLNPKNEEATYLLEDWTN